MFHGTLIRICLETNKVLIAWYSYIVSTSTRAIFDTNKSSKFRITIGRDPGHL